MSVYRWLQNALNSRFRRAIFLTLVTLVYAGYYSRQLQLDAAIYGDMVGKLLQVEDLLVRDFGDFSCRYQHDFDPQFRYLPGPDYFYVVHDGECKYLYPYAYAFAVAPFVLLAGDGGHILLNLICLWLAAMAMFPLGATILPEFRWGDLALGLSAILIIPNGIYLLDFSEMSLAMAVWSWSTAFIATALWRPLSPARNALYLIAAGILAGLAFSLRTESAIVAASTIAAIAVDGICRDWRNESGSVRVWILRARTAAVAALPAAVGYSFGVAIVAIAHLLLFGNALGFRGAYIADMARAGFSIENQLFVAGQLLFGGSLGLFSSLPFVLLSYLFFLPAVRRRVLRPGLFFALAANLSVLAIAATSPVDGGYSWSPRYLALTLPAFLALVALVLYGAGQSLTRPIFWIPGALLLIYSLVFPHIGMKVAIQATRQTSLYAAQIDQINPGAIVVRSPFLFTVLGRRHYNRPIFSCLDDSRCAELMSTLAAESFREPLVVLSIGPTVAWSAPRPWQLTRTSMIANVTFQEFALAR